MGMCDARVLATDRVSRSGMGVREGRGGAHGKGVVGVVAHELPELLLDAVLQHRDTLAGEVRLERPILAAVHGGTLAPPPLPPQPQPPQFEAANVAASYGRVRGGSGGEGGCGRMDTAGKGGTRTRAASGSVLSGVWTVPPLCGAAVRVWGEGRLLALVRFSRAILGLNPGRTDAAHARSVRRHPGGSGRGPAGSPGLITGSVLGCGKQDLSGQVGCSGVGF